MNHFPCDLARAGEIERVAAALDGFLRREVPRGRILLINNSGFGSFGRFLDLDLERELQMVDLNVRAVVHLTGKLLPLLRERGGAVMNIASTVAFQPTPFAATYGAGKAFVLHWTVALNEELRGTGVRALAVCPGTTTTEFFQAAGVGVSGVAAAFRMTSEAVVEKSFRALAAGRTQVVPGWHNQIYSFLGARLPKPVAARVAALMLARIRGQKERA